MRQAGRDVWTPVAGVMAAVTFVVGALLLFNMPDSSHSDARLIAWYADHGHQVANVVGVYVLAFCGLFLLWFASRLRDRLRPAEGGGRTLANVAFAGGVLFVGMLWLGASSLAAISGGELFGNAPPLRTADLSRFSPGYAAILIFAMFGAIALIGATSLLIMRSALLPRWLGRLGFVACFALLFAAVFLPMIALPIWLLAASVALFRTPALEGASVVPAPAT